MQTSYLLKKETRKKRLHPVTIVAIVLLLAPVFCTAQGTNMSNPIIMGTYGGGTFSYTDTKNNGGYGNDYGQASEDIFYKFTVQGSTTITISHCASGFDTYVHLLDGSGVLITYNDDNGPLCSGSTASISTTIAAGTYYIVSEGWSTNSGSITTAVSLTVQAPPPPPPPPVVYDTRNFIKTWEATAPETDANNLITRGIADVKHSVTYFDGLGRPEQTVVKKGSLSSSGNTDLVSPVVYDAFGREAQKYLPYVSTSSDGSFKTNALTEQNTFYTGTSSPVAGQGETFFYGKTDFEASPLNRTLKTYAPGNNWAGANRGVEAQYLVNTLTDAVRIWTVADVANNFGTYNTSSTNGIYPAGELYKNLSIDEHGKKIIEYKDKEGQVILKKVQIADIPGEDHTGWLCTYYIYDDLNQLRAVIQPKAVEQLQLPEGAWSLTTTQLDELAFRYEYDHRGRMIMKKVPGAGAVWMVYDARDRLVLTQDANLRGQSKWMFTKYDQLNRSIMTGFYVNGTYTTQNGMQTYLNVQNMGLYETYNPANYPQYSLNNSFPSLANLNDVLTITYYDDYDWSTPYGSHWKLKDNTFDTYFSATSNSYPYPQSITQTTSTKGLVTGLVESTGTGMISTFYYDDKGRVIQTKRHNITGGIDIATTQYSFSEQVLQTVLKQEKLGTNAQTTVVVTQNTYDDLSRIIKVEKKLSNTNVNGGAMSSLKAVVQNEYDALGQLKKKKFGTIPNTTNELAKMEYDYNIRGWVLGMNRNYLKNNNAGGYEENYFGFELGYDKSATTPGTTGFGYLNYNGNIAGTIWKTKGDQVRRYYDFLYDNANRLGRANYYQYTSPGNGSTWTTTETSFSVHGNDPAYNNAVSGNNNYITYDANGNILGMVQHGWKALNPNSILDALSYNYYDNSNRLKNVVDGAQDKNTKLGDFRYSSLYENTVSSTKSSIVTDYTYDANGNLKKDLNKDIGTSGSDGITYNHLNLPSTITVTGKGSIEYIYDAAGNKLKKVVHETNKPDKTTLYIGGSVYEDEELKFLSHEEGRIRYKKASTTCTALPNRFIYDYFVKDHLGNIRMVLTEQKEDVCYIAASVEDSRYLAEDDIYNIQNGRRIDKATTGASQSSFENKLYRTHGNISGEKTGLGAVLKVMSGDQVKITAESFYTMPGGGPGAPLTMAVTDLLTAFTGSGTINAAKGALTPTQVEGIGTNSSNIGGFISGNNPGTNNAKAFLNWVLFDDQLKYVSSGADPVQTNGGYKLHTAFINAPVSVTKNGFLYVFVSNESNLAVYFDNLAITHTPGAIVEETHYYPFGLTMAGISSKAAGGVENKVGFQGKELQSKEFSDGTGLELYDFGAREQDPQLGRWWTVDPKAEKYYSSSPYNFVDNNPIIRIDPTGKDWFYYQAKGEDKKTWHYKEGRKATYTNAKRKEKTVRGYSHLVAFVANGKVNDAGAKMGTLVVYNQDKVQMIVPEAFTGGNRMYGFPPVNEGTYMMRMDIKDREGPKEMNAARDNPVSHFGAQKIPNRHLESDGRSYDVGGSWGTGRIRLNEVDENLKIVEKSTDRGAYLHGKLNSEINWTHGCICDKSEAVFNYLWNNVNGHVPFIVQ
jgi:RHS repeat-associated protein